MKASSLAWHLIKIMAQGGDFEVALHDPYSDDSFSLEDRAGQTPPAFDFNDDDATLYLSVKRESLPLESPFQVIGRALSRSLTPPSTTLTTDTLEPTIKTAASMTDAEHWLTHEKGIWRVQFNKSFDQVPRIHYVQASEHTDEHSVRCWQLEHAPKDVRIVSCRRATVADVPELERLAEGEE